MTLWDGNVDVWRVDDPTASYEFDFRTRPTRLSTHPIRKEARMTVLAIDQGTSGTKAVVVSEDGDVLAIAETAVRPAYLAAGGVEQDPSELLDSVLDAGRRAVAQAGAPVSAVSLANQGETVLAWDPDTGAPLSPAVVWQDRRSEAAVPQQVRVTSRGSHSGPGLVLDPYFSAPKMAWLRQNATASGVVTTTDTWIVHHLTGEFVTDAATASRSLLTDLDTVAWDAAAARAVRARRPSGCPPSSPTTPSSGTTDAFGADAAVGGLDRRSAGRAAGASAASTPGTAKCTFGTGAFLLANTGTLAGPLQPPGWRRSVAWNVRGKTSYCVDGQAYTAASADPVDPGPRLDRVGAATSTVWPRTMPAERMFVPALAGLAAPWWRPDADGVVHRDDAVHRPVPAGRRRPRGAGGADRRAGVCRRRRPGRSADPAAGGRRADPVAAASCRPPPT